MNRVELHALANVLVILLVATLVVGLWPLFGARSLAALGLLGIIPLNFGLLLRWGSSCQVITDERDGVIVGKAMHIAHGWFWCVMAIACWIPFISPGIQGTVPAAIISLAALAGAIGWVLVFSAATLIQCRRDRSGAS